MSEGTSNGSGAPPPLPRDPTPAPSAVPQMKHPPRGPGRSVRIRGPRRGGPRNGRGGPRGAGAMRGRPPIRRLPLTRGVLQPHPGVQQSPRSIQVSQTDSPSVQRSDPKAPPPIAHPSPRVKPTHLTLKKGKVSKTIETSSPSQLPQQIQKPAPPPLPRDPELPQQESEKLQPSPPLLPRESGADGAQPPPPLPSRLSSLDVEELGLETPDTKESANQLQKSRESPTCEQTLKSEQIDKSKENPKEKILKPENSKEHPVNPTSEQIPRAEHLHDPNGNMGRVRGNKRRGRPPTRTPPTRGLIKSKTEGVVLPARTIPRRGNQVAHNLPINRELEGLMQGSKTIRPCSTPGGPTLAELHFMSGSGEVLLKKSGRRKSSFHPGSALLDLASIRSSSCVDLTKDAKHSISLSQLPDFRLPLVGSKKSHVSLDDTSLPCVVSPPRLISAPSSPVVSSPVVSSPVVSSPFALAQAKAQNGTTQMSVTMSPTVTNRGGQFENRLSLANVMPKIGTLPLFKKSKKFNSNVYQQCFSGKAAVKWMLTAELGISYEWEAEIMGELLLNANIIVPLQRDPNFVNSSKSIYALVEGIVPLNDDELPKKERKKGGSHLSFKSKSKTLGRNKASRTESGEVERAPILFGAKLEDIMALQSSSNPDLKIPLIVDILIAAVIEHGGRETEGIFRVPGKNTEIFRLRDQFETLDYSITSTDANDLAGCLKMWFRELKEPLIPEEYYNDCIAAANDPVECIEIIKRLPELNRRVADAMLSFLVDMSKHSDKTKMGAGNLAMVFAPGFLGAEDAMRMMMNAATEGKFIEGLIKQYQPGVLDLPSPSSD